MTAGKFDGKRACEDKEVNSLMAWSHQNNNTDHIQGSGDGVRSRTMTTHAFHHAWCVMLRILPKVENVSAEVILSRKESMKSSRPAMAGTRLYDGIDHLKTVVALSVIFLPYYFFTVILILPFAI